MNGRAEVIGHPNRAIEFSAQQRADHEHDEQIIDAGLATFIEVGRALLRIRDRRSYLLTHSTFGIYCRQRWRFNSAYAYNLMLGAEVIDVLESHQVEVLPPNARVAYELRGLLEEPDRLVDAWQRTVNEHGDKPLARHVTRVLRGDGQSTTSPRDPAGRVNIVEHELGDDALAYGEAIASAAKSIERAKELQRKALTNIHPDVAAQWAREVKRLRTLAADVQRALDRKR